jgi:hypothetical protein
LFLTPVVLSDGRFALGGYKAWHRGDHQSPVLQIFDADGKRTATFEGARENEEWKPNVATDGRRLYQTSDVYVGGRQVLARLDAWEP